jgi:hypothetical protein
VWTAWGGNSGRQGKGLRTEGGRLQNDGSPDNCPGARRPRTYFKPKQMPGDLRIQAAQNGHREKQRKEQEVKGQVWESMISKRELGAYREISPFLREGTSQ